MLNMNWFNQELFLENEVRQLKVSQESKLETEML